MTVQGFEPKIYRTLVERSTNQVEHMHQPNAVGIFDIKLCFLHLKKDSINGHAYTFTGAIEYSIFWPS